MCKLFLGRDSHIGTLRFRTRSVGRRHVLFFEFILNHIRHLRTYKFFATYTHRHLQMLRFWDTLLNLNRLTQRLKKN